MKITKKKLLEIIKEELILIINEDVGSMSGAGVPLPDKHKNFANSSEAVNANLEQVHRKLDLIMAHFKVGS